MQRKSIRRCDWILILFSAVFIGLYTFSSFVVVAWAEEGGGMISTDLSKFEESRQIIKSRLVELGYNEEDACRAVSELSEKEIIQLAKHPKVLTKTGAAAAATAALLCLTTMDENSSNKTTSTPKVKTREVIKTVIKKECPVCHGKGKRPCPDCDGTGNSGVKDEWGNELPCKRCGGTGYLKEDCHNCNGTGYIEE